MNIEKELTYEEKLDEALMFLSTHGAKGASFDYYDKRGADGNNISEYLFKYLLSIGIKEHEMMPIVYYLYEEKFIDANWQEHEVPKASGNPPNQIKITFKGILFINNGGYVAKHRLLNQDAQEIAQLKLRQSQMANRLFWINVTIAFGTLIAAVYYVLMVIDYCKSHHVFCCP